MLPHYENEKMIKHCVLAVILSFGIVVVSTESVEDCTVKAHLPCTLHSGVSDCSPPELQAKFPFFTANDSWPGKVSSFEGIVTDDQYVFNNKTYTFPKGQFTFTPPQDVGIRFVKGFVVMRYRSDTTFPACYIYDLSNATWKSGTEDFKTVFTLTLFPMMPNSLYVLEVYTLPKLPSEFEALESLSLSVKIRGNPGNDPLTWQASISFQLKEDSREVYISFSKPPEDYNFTEFEVTLRNLSAGSRQNTIVTQTEHTFTEVTNGVYEIWVMPIQTTMCRCRKSQYVCENCATTKTSNFTVEFAFSTTTKKPSTSELAFHPGPSTSELAFHPGPSTSELAFHPGPSTSELAFHPGPSTSELASLPVTSTQYKIKEDESVKIILAVMGSLLGVGLVVFMLMLYYFCRRKTRGDENDNYKPPAIEDDCDSMVTVTQFKAGALINNQDAEKVKMERRPKLFILYEEDHDCHHKVIDCFARYLHCHCQCDVMCALIRLDAAWVHQEIQNADYVIIVNSQLAFAIYKSLISKNREDSKHSVSESIKTPGINCILQRFLQEPHYDKTVMVYFDYTSEVFVIPDICPGYNYKLMKHFSDLLLHIHKLKRTDNLAKYDLPLDGKFYLKPEGRNLQTAITAAAAYERGNPDWFSQKYRYLRSFSNASEESGFDSGLPQDPLDPTSAQLKSYLDGISQDCLTVAPLSIPISGDNTYLALSPHSFQRHIYGDINQDKPSLETPTTADSGGQFDFIPPDDLSESDNMSKTLSEQMMSINNRNIGLQYDNKGYNWQQDLTLLRVQSGEITFEDAHSLGGESV